MTAAARIIIGAVLVLTAAAVEVRAQIIDLFDAREHRCSEGRFAGKVFQYRLFVPRTAKPGEHFPLILWFHGAGERGNNNVRHMKWIDLMLDDPMDAEKYRFFVLAVQCPTELQWFDHGGDSTEGRSEDMLTVTYDILQETMLDNPVDRDRVYLIGISSGAGAAFEMAMRHPALFAALLPLSCLGSDELRAAKLIKIPIWAFINKGERAGVERMVAAVQSAGGNVHLNIADVPGHNAWSAPLQGGILEWILAQRKGRFCWTPPGHDAWQWWHILIIPAAFVVFVRFAWSLERRRRWWRLRVGRSRSTAATSHQGDQPERVSGWTSASVSQVVEQNVEQISEMKVPH